MKHGHTYKRNNSSDPFPFSDLSQAKLRPAVVPAFAGRTDWILCQVTSNPYGDERAIVLGDADFEIGSLRVISYARPGKLYTANDTLIREQVGSLKPEILQKLVDAIVELLNRVNRNRSTVLSPHPACG